LKTFPMFLVAGAAGLLIELSGSRAAAIAAWVVTAVVVLASGNWGKRAWLAWLAFVAALTASVVTAVGDFPADFATWRGSLWARAHELFAESPIIGSGPGYWVKQPSENGFIANYSPHNQWLEIAISGGVLALLGALIAGVTLLRGVPKQERYALVLALTALLALGILEAPVQAGRIGLAPFSHLLPLMVAASCALVTGSQATRSRSLLPLADRSPALR
jgi:O-antigen ligase